jgi:hypothetical protein
MSANTPTGILVECRACEDVFRAAEDSAAAREGLCWLCATIRDGGPGYEPEDET